jgi:hypothetical protein
MSFAYHSFCFLVCARTLSIGKVLVQYFPPVFTKLVSTPKKSILPILELTQKIICAKQNKTNSIEKLTMATATRDDDGGVGPLSNVLMTTMMAASGGSSSNVLTTMTRAATPKEAGDWEDVRQQGMTMA